MRRLGYSMAMPKILHCNTSKGAVALQPPPSTASARGKDNFQLHVIPVM
jgi:hypothetical protein